MSDYQPLPLKYRPKTFSDLVGQKHAVAVLTSSLRQGKVFPTYIFSGTRGSGKTSAARIFAMALNCQALTDVSDVEPCLECPSCVEALKQRNPDINEIDGPSYGRVEHIRDLKEKTLFSPHFNKKVFIIDEAHSLSRDAWEAFLKLLEEPPSHVVFVLATTNPEKIPPTIHSRSIPLDFRRHTEDDVIGRLLYIGEQENIQIDEAAAGLIARYADGALRDSVTVLDQLKTSHHGEPVTPELLTSTLGIVSGTELLNIMTAVVNHDAKKLDEVLTDTLSRTTEFGLIVRAITDWYTDVLRVKCEAYSAVQRAEGAVQLLEEFARKLDFQKIDTAIRICWDMSERVRYSSTAPRSFFLTGLYRLMLLTDAPPPEEQAGPPPPTENVQDLTQTEAPTTFSGNPDELLAELNNLTR